MSKPEAGGRPLRRDAERNRQLIIASAKAAFAERGLQVTLDDVAARAGLGVGTVYRKFPNRAALVGALFEDRVAEVEALVDRSAGSDGPPWDALAELITGLAVLHAEDRGLREVLLADERAGDQFATTLRRLRPRLRLVLDRARADGSLRADLGVDDLPVLMAMIGTAADRSGSGWRRYLDLIMDGLRTGGERR
ncbi:TetR/AcrR family transcriptional regulator [Microlunatus sp. GCM10028923]|uniref:TetR/AcrR family transcriptional regulator n=1 Tax=Microlunatus sp. GCM10028923 TaxID=3273400 RepID=UPI003620BA60